MAAELEEALLDAHAVEAQHLGPDAGDEPLHLGAGGRIDDGRRIAVRSGQGPAVELAVGGQRQLRQQDDGGGQHVLGQACRQVGAQLGGAERGPGLRHGVGDQAASSAGESWRSTAAAWRTAAWAASAASISPGSMRKPRTLTCGSMRPRNSMRPSGARRARSPVR